MDYKGVIEEQITILQKLQNEIDSSNLNALSKSEAAVKIAEEINCLVAHAKDIKKA
jgi:hypothetical protein